MSLKQELINPELAPPDIQEDVISILRARARDATSIDSSRPVATHSSREPLTAEQWVKRRGVAIATRRSMRAEGAFMSLKQELINPELAPPDIRDDVIRMLRARGEWSR